MLLVFGESSSSPKISSPKYPSLGWFAFNFLISCRREEGREMEPYASVVVGSATTGRDVRRRRALGVAACAFVLLGAVALTALVVSSLHSPRDGWNWVGGERGES